MSAQHTVEHVLCGHPRGMLYSVRLIHGVHLNTGSCTVKLVLSRRPRGMLYSVRLIQATSFPGLFPFELGRPTQFKRKSPGNEVVIQGVHSIQVPIQSNLY